MILFCGVETIEILARERYRAKRQTSPVYLLPLGVIFPVCRKGGGVRHVECRFICWTNRELVVFIMQYGVFIAGVMSKYNFCNTSFFRLRFGIKFLLIKGEFYCHLIESGLN